MNRPDPFADHRARLNQARREPLLMDLSTAKPSDNVNWEAILAKTQRASADPSKKIYDTSKYLQTLREEDPWPEEANATPVPMTLTNCQFLDASPVDLARRVRVTCEVTSQGELPEDDRWVEFRIWVVRRQRDLDQEEPFQTRVTGKLGAGTTHRPQVEFDLSTVIESEPLPPGEQIYLIAEAMRKDRNLSAKSKPIATLAGPTVVRRVRISGMFYDEGKAFFHPAVVPALKSIVARHRKDPRQPIVIVAHAKSQEDSAIALARAQLLRAQLTNQWPLLLAEFEPSVSDKRRLGLREAQLILGDLGAYKGQAAGMMDDETRAALKAYQKGAALPESGTLDTATRKSLLHGYFGREGTTATKDARIEVCTCTGKTDSVKLPCGEAVEDDRVEVLFFEPRLEGDVPQSADGRWDKWMKQVRETEDVERYGLHLRITDHNGVVCPGARVKVIGPTTQETKADEHGWVSIVPLERGHYHVELWEDAERIGESELDIPARGREAVGNGLHIVPIFVDHFHEGHHLPRLSDDTFLQTVANLADHKKKCGKLEWEANPDCHLDHSLQDKQRKLVECLIDNDADAWLGFVKGARDRDVQSFMAFFAKQGWPTDPGAIDGVAGRKTRRAVAQFQACCNEVWGLCLVVDGQCGPKTWKAIFHALQEMIKTSEIGESDINNLEGDKS